MCKVFAFEDFHISVFWLLVNINVHSVSCGECRNRVLCLWWDTTHSNCASYTSLRALQHFSLPLCYSSSLRFVEWYKPAGNLSWSSAQIFPGVFNRFSWWTVALHPGESLNKIKKNFFFFGWLPVYAEASVRKVSPAYSFYLHQESHSAIREQYLS